MGYKLASFGVGFSHSKKSISQLFESTPSCFLASEFPLETSGAKFIAGLSKSSGKSFEFGESYKAVSV